MIQRDCCPNSLCYHLGSPRKDRQLASDRSNTWKTACCISRKLHWGIVSWQVRTLNIFLGGEGIKKETILCLLKGAYRDMLAASLWAEERRDSVFSIALSDLILVMIFSFLSRHFETSTQNPCQFFQDSQFKNIMKLYWTDNIKEL